MKLVSQWLPTVLVAREAGSIEKILGPIHGFYIASYAAPAPGATLFTSYAKIFRHRPTTYWDAPCLFKLFGGEHHASVTAAIAGALSVARNQIDDLPSLECSTFGLDLPYFDAPAAVAV